MGVTGVHEELLDKFATSQRRLGLRANTIEQRDRFMRRFLIELDVMEATAADIEDWLDRQPGRGPNGISAKTRSTYLSYLSVFYEWLFDQARRDENPVRKIGRPRVPRRLPRPAATADLALVLEPASLMMKAWLLLATYEGLRCCEIAGLRREDVLDTRAAPLLMVGESAKGGSDGALPLNPAVLGALQAYGMPASGPVFLNEAGKPFTANAVSKRIRAHMLRCGVSATAHRWRHTYGSEVYRLTRDLRLTQELMRHRDPSTTAGYVAINPAVAGIEVVMGFGANES